MNTEYECQGFHDLLPKGKSSGLMTVSATEIVFRIQEQIIRLPIQGLDISLGGASNRLIFFSHPFVKGWSFYTSDRKILNDVHLKNRPSIARLLESAKHKHWLGWGSIALVAFIVIALPTLIVLRMDFFSEKIAKQIPVEWEEKISEASMAQYQLGKTLMKKEETDKLLNPLVQPLITSLDNSRYQYQLMIVNEGSLNAFALPGGKVVIHSALILRAKSAEELLGVLAHEIIHVEQQHGVRNLIGASGVYMIASAIFGDVSGLLAVLTSTAPLLLNQSYSRGFETEADVKGFELLLKANINPSGLASFFQTMLEEEKKQLEKIEDEKNREIVKKALSFLSTHPTSEARIKKLQGMLSGLDSNPNYRYLATEFSTLQTAVTEFVTNNREDEANEK
jgi:beta-barrel assembly-enhancing protease